MGDAGPQSQHSPPAPPIEIAIVDLPHLSNFTDFDAFQVEPDVRVRIVRAADDLNGPDALIVGGSKNTLGDLAWLEASGVAARIRDYARRQRGEVVGICGGFQMLGEEIHDPLALESAVASAPGLGLLKLKTVMAAEKILARTTARHAASGLEVTGYEIHHGRTETYDCPAVFSRPDGQVLGAGSADGCIWGTYLHGVFDADAFRRWFIDRLRARRGLGPHGPLGGRYDIEPALDRLAAAVRAALPIGEIYRLMGLR
jgi:cobyric acid synthase